MRTHRRIDPKAVHASLMSGEMSVGLRMPPFANTRRYYSKQAHNASRHTMIYMQVHCITTTLYCRTLLAVKMTRVRLPQVIRPQRASLRCGISQLYQQAPSNMIFHSMNYFQHLIHKHLQQIWGAFIALGHFVHISKQKDIIKTTQSVIFSSKNVVHDNKDTTGTVLSSHRTSKNGRVSTHPQGLE